MTSRLLYEGVLIELNKENAPNILLEDFNYFANKAINNYVNKRYNIYDINQQTTDDLRVLKATAMLKPLRIEEYSGLTMAGDDHMATYEVIMPSDYLHILNCICIYKVKKTYKCYNVGDTWRSPAKRLTADMYSQVLDNFWNRPSYKNPYYYIHNVNYVDTKDSNFYEMLNPNTPDTRKVYHTKNNISTNPYVYEKGDIIQKDLTAQTPPNSNGKSRAASSPKIASTSLSNFNTYITYRLPEDYEYEYGNKESSEVEIDPETEEPTAQLKVTKKIVTKVKYAPTNTFISDGSYIKTVTKDYVETKENLNTGEVTEVKVDVVKGDVNDKLTNKGNLDLVGEYIGKASPDTTRESNTTTNTTHIISFKTLGTYGKTNTFLDTVTIEIGFPIPNPYTIYYSINDSTMTQYHGQPFTITETSKVKAIATRINAVVDTIELTFTKVSLVYEKDPKSVINSTPRVPASNINAGGNSGNDDETTEGGGSGIKHLKEGTDASFDFKYGDVELGTDYWKSNIINGRDIPGYITLTDNKGLDVNVSLVERGAGIRYGNVSQVRLEIRYGTDNLVFELVNVYVDYIKAPQNIRLTQKEIDLTEDTSQMLEYPDYVCQEIINELVHLVMENISDLRLQTHPVVSLSIANPAQALAPALGLNAQ